MPSQSRIKNTTFPRLPCSTVTGKSDPHKTWRQKRVACAGAECRQINLGASVGVAASGSGTATVELLEPASNRIRARWGGGGRGIFARTALWCGSYLRCLWMRRSQLCNIQSDYLALPEIL